MRYWIPIVLIIISIAGCENYVYGITTRIYHQKDISSYPNHYSASTPRFQSLQNEKCRPINDKDCHDCETIGDIFEYKNSHVGYQICTLGSVDSGVVYQYIWEPIKKIIEGGIGKDGIGLWRLNKLSSIINSSSFFKVEVDYTLENDLGIFTKIYYFKDYPSLFTFIFHMVKVGNIK